MDIPESGAFSPPIWRRYTLSFFDRLGLLHLLLVLRPAILFCILGTSHASGRVAHSSSSRLTSAFRSPLTNTAACQPPPALVCLFVLLTVPFHLYAAPSRALVLFPAECFGRFFPPFQGGAPPPPAAQYDCLLLENLAAAVLPPCLPFFFPSQPTPPPRSRLTVLIHLTGGVAVFVLSVHHNLVFFPWSPSMHLPPVFSPRSLCLNVNSRLGTLSPPE